MDMDWRYFFELFKAVFLTSHGIFTSIPAYISILLFLVRWLCPTIKDKRMSILSEKLKAHPALICMSFLMISVILASHSLYVNKPSIFATPDELIPSVLENMTIRISDLVREDHVIRNRIFKNCYIYGPAMIGVKNVNIFINSGIEGNYDITFIETTNKLVIGVIEIQDCTFTDCHFRKIGFIGSPENIAKLKPQILPKKLD